MDRKHETFHYHIRWQGGGGTLDWEMWSTRAAAEYSARQIVQPGETCAEPLSNNHLTSQADRRRCARTTQDR
jgi:hypothetical protein